MITKEIFIDFIDNYDKFSDIVDKLEETLNNGRRSTTNLYDTDGFIAVGNMFDLFIQSHFTEDGQDLINGYMFDNLYEHKLEIHTNGEVIFIHTTEDLWNYISSNSKAFIL